MNSRKKIIKLEALKRKIRQSSRTGKKIAFTNGCFDILHAGHVEYLESAKKKDRILIVGLNSDSSVKKIKGSNRPINPEGQRAAVLAALECVDYVTIFKEETPYQLIKAIGPDVLIKGADWKSKGVVGADIIKANGGKVELIRYIPGVSTTKVLKTIKKRV